MDSSLTKCPRCGGANTVKAGRMANGLQMRKCKDCKVAARKYAYSLSTIFGRKSGLPEEKWDAVRMLIERGVGYNDIREIIGVANSTISKIAKGAERPLCVCGRVQHNGGSAACIKSKAERKAQALAVPYVRAVLAVLRKSG